jgi:hypothetical protein
MLNGAFENRELRLSNKYWFTVTTLHNIFRTATGWMGKEDALVSTGTY